MSVITCSFPANLPFKTSKPLIKHVNKIVVLKNSQVPCKKSPEIQISGFSDNNKVEQEIISFSFSFWGVFGQESEKHDVVCVVFFFFLTGF